MADIYDEVNEELRADQMMTAIRRLGPLFGVAALIVILAVAAWKFQQHRLDQQAQGDSAQYFAALQLAQAQDDASRKQAAAQFAALADKSNPGYRTLSRLYAAALDAQTGQMDQADKIWDAVQQDNDADPSLRGLAGLLWAQHHVDSGEPAAVEAHLATIREPGNQWRPLAEECAAMLELRQGHAAQARRTLHALIDDYSALPSVRQRAALILEEIGS